jgi:DNA-binding NtrC family response regulator
MIRIVVVDDNEECAQAVANIISKAIPEAQVHGFTDPFLALRYTFEEKPDLVIVDFMMPKMDGIVLLREMRKIGVEALAVIMSGYTTERMPKLLPQNGVAAVIEKPVRLDMIAEIARKVTVRQRELATG